ncbi:MAG: hypothetical protein V3R69_01790 [candidate division NC10 bacterium]|nr:hypothetical protein [candidate division NC10 bacterium]
MGRPLKACFPAVCEATGAAVIGPVAIFINRIPAISLDLILIAGGARKRC